MQPAGRRQAQARAGTAERHALVGDHAEEAAAGNLVAQRGGIQRCRRLDELVALGDLLQQLGHAIELLLEAGAFTGQMAHAHQLDEAQLEAVLQAVVEHRQHLLVVLPAQRHHVDLDLQPGSPRLRQALQHGRQIATTGDALEGDGVEGIQGHVDALEPALQQQRQLAREQLAIAGQADVLQAQATDAAQEVFELGADQRLAAGDAQALDAGRLDQVGHAAHHGLGGQLVLRRHQTLAVRHTVGAGVVAGGGQADAQVTKAPTLAINDHGQLRQCSLRSICPPPMAKNASLAG